MSILKRNNVQVMGEGASPILFAHGYGCDQKMWRHLTPAFEREFKVVLFDYVGSGESDLSSFSRSRYSSLAGYAQDVLEICDALDLEECAFVGHSVSSMVGALASIQSPSRISKLVMIGPSPCYMNDGEYQGGFARKDIEGLLELLESNPTAWAQMMAPLIMGNENRPELSEELRSSFCRADPLIANHFARVTFLSDNRADLQRVNAKSLILQCANDAIAPVHIGQYVHKNMPNSELVLLTAQGHCPHLSAPCEVATHMHRFLRDAS